MIRLRVTGDQKLAEEWELVLLAQGLSPSLGWSPEGVVLSVPASELDRAIASLSAYERENPGIAREPDEPISLGSLLAGVFVALLLLLFFFVTVEWLPELPWFERGSADAQRIIQGELWRAVTALTLHADAAHALSNAVAAAVFLTAVASVMGTGLGGALVLLAGAGGNLVNALMQGAPHVAVGASTAVFGAVGLLGGAMTWRRRGTFKRRRSWLPMAAALALLAMLGTSGPRVDVWAHLFGLLVGAMLGILISSVAPQVPRFRTQWASGTAAMAILVYSWTLALL